MHPTPKRVSVLACVTALTAFAVFPQVVGASTWGPTVLVNTESFQTIDEGDSTTDIEIRFGDSLGEKLFWDRTYERFDFTDDIHVEGNITGSGGLAIEENIRAKGDLTINSDNGAADATLTFGNDAAAESLKFSNTTERFEFSDDVYIPNTLTVDGAATFGSTITLNGITYTFPASGQANGYVLKTNGAGTLSWEQDSGGVSMTDGELRYVNVAGDTMTGTLTIGNNAGLTASGAIQTEAGVTLNKDNAAQDATLTFGNDAGAETLKFSDSANRFEFSDDLKVGGNLSGSTLTVDGQVTIRGQNYLFPTNGGSDGQFLQTDGAGNLTWAATSVGNGSGGIVAISPEYPNAVYFGSGSAAIGQLAYAFDAASSNNYYRWTSTKGTSQNYWMALRVQVPKNFAAWDPVSPVTFQYRTGTANSAENSVTVRLLDTAGAPIVLTGGSALANTSWTTATVTGPQSTGTYTAGGYITVLIKLAATSAGSADAGTLALNWQTTTP